MKTINEIAIKTYGYNAIEIDATAALWLAENILASTGKNVFKKISNARWKAGKPTAFPSFGSALYKSL